MSEAKLTEICNKFGKVLQCRLFTGMDHTGQLTSQGKAIITYANTDDAAKAMQKLYYEDELGQYVNVDFYKSRELRMQQSVESSEITQ